MDVSTLAKLTGFDRGTIADWIAKIDMPTLAGGSAGRRVGGRVVCHLIARLPLNSGMKQIATYPSAAALTPNVFTRPSG
ncbi:MAG: hypothetical protein C0429_18275 [Sphingopyxis sp.]|nr:hypothetical protein [Sphingopyxis sp.]